MKKYRIVIIKPAVKCLQSIHQSCRIGAEIRFPIAEFKIVDSCPKSLHIQALLYKSLKSSLNHLYKGFLLILIGLLCNNGENRLLHSIIIGAHNILTDFRIQKSLL